MAEIDLGKVRGEDGQGSGPTFEEKTMIFERQGYTKQGIWYRKLAESLVEIGIDFFETSFTMAANTSRIVFTLPEGYKPKCRKYSCVTYGTGVIFGLDVDGAGVVTFRNCSSTSQNIAYNANYGISLIFTID